MSGPKKVLTKKEHDQKTEELKRAKEQFKLMTIYQNDLNCVIADDWQVRKFPWHRAIWSECAELMDHYGWKWWKKQEVNINQVKLELVDIWHFILSHELSHHTKLLDVSADNISEKLIKIYEHANNGLRELDHKHFLNIVESMAAHAAQGSVRALFFFQLMKIINMNMNELFKLYVGKYTLNKFRQANGYNQGTYVKMWGDREDNEHLMHVLNWFDDHHLERYQSHLFTRIVYNSLQKTYDEVNEVK